MVPACMPNTTTDQPDRVLLADAFEAGVRAGRVVGASLASDATPRQGFDAEGLIAIDHRQLRIGTLRRPGWGRAAVAYPAIDARPGLGVMVHVLNGHNASGSYRLSVRSLLRTILRCCLGAGDEAVVARFVSVPLVRLRWGLASNVRRWLASTGKASGHVQIDENLCVGWFDGASDILDPVTARGMVMRGVEGEGGELCACFEGIRVPIITGVQNVPIVCMVVHTGGGTVLYAGSLDGSWGLGSVPHLRPLFIDRRDPPRRARAGVHQSVLGQIGFRVDTRVRRIAAADLPEWSEWCGGALLADRLTGDGPLELEAPERGGIPPSWRLDSGTIARGHDGARAMESDQGAADLQAAVPIGLVHARVRPGSGSAGLRARTSASGDAWSLEVSRTEARLKIRIGGHETVFAHESLSRFSSDAGSSLQLLDDGLCLTAIVGSERLFGGAIIDDRLASNTGVGIFVAGGATICDFQAHPREVPLPSVLDPGELWDRRGTRTVIDDAFTGAPGDLHHRLTPAGTSRWERTLGRGFIEATGDGSARVRASRDRPNPVRTLYTLAWHTPGFADLAVQMTPPGTGRGEKHNGRCGLVLWQDPGTWMILNLWLADEYPGASLSSFFRVNGREDLYDAVWTNIGTRAQWGRPFELRVAFDGDRFVARIDGEPVLARAVTDVYPWAKPMNIRRVGLAANWEWGHDTGTAFHRFTARDDAPAGPS